MACVYLMFTLTVLYTEVATVPNGWEWWRTPVIPRLGGLRWSDGLRSGPLLVAALCRSGVPTKPGVNMVG